LGVPAVGERRNAYFILRNAPQYRGTDGCYERRAIQKVAGQKGIVYANAQTDLFHFTWMVVAVGAFGASTTGVISGVVVDGTGAPIAGALVLYTSVPPLVKGADGRPVANGPLVSARLTTAADGTFTAGGLPPAKYSLCVYGMKSTDLGPCEWGRGTTVVDLAAGQTAQLSFQIASGAMLTFQVSDPNRRVRDLADIPVSSGRVALSGANFAIGVWAGMRYARATLVSTSAAGTRQYQLAIPRTASVRLYLDTSLSVTDATGAAITTAQPSLTLAPAGQAEITTDLTIP
jgi:hypothetical protein